MKAQATCAAALCLALWPAGLAAELVAGNARAAPAAGTTMAMPVSRLTVPIGAGLGASDYIWNLHNAQPALSPAPRVSAQELEPAPAPSPTPWEAAPAGAASLPALAARAKSAPAQAQSSPISQAAPEVGLAVQPQAVPGQAGALEGSAPAAAHDRMRLSAVPAAPVTARLDSGPGGYTAEFLSALWDGAARRGAEPLFAPAAGLKTPTPRGAGEASLHRPLPRTRPAPHDSLIIGPALGSKNAIRDLAAMPMSRSQKTLMTAARLGFLALGIVPLAALDIGVVEKYLHYLNTTCAIPWETFNIKLFGRDILKWWLYYIPCSLGLMALIGGALSRLRGAIAGMLLFATGLEDILYYVLQWRPISPVLDWLDMNPLVSWTRLVTGTPHVTSAGLLLASLVGLLAAFALLWPRRFAWIRRIW